MKITTKIKSSAVHFFGGQRCHAGACCKQKFTSVQVGDLFVCVCHCFRSKKPQYPENRRFLSMPHTDFPTIRIFLDCQFDSSEKVGNEQFTTNVRRKLPSRTVAAVVAGFITHASGGAGQRSRARFRTVVQAPRKSPCIHIHHTFIVWTSVLGQNTKVYRYETVEVGN